MARGWKLEGKRSVRDLRKLPGVDRAVSKAADDLARRAVTAAGETGVPSHPSWTVAPMPEFRWSLPPGFYRDDRDGKTGRAATVMGFSPSPRGRERARKALRAALAAGKVT